MTLLGVDGGNSKTDLALVSADGALLALERGPTISHQQVPMDEAMRRLAALARRAERRAALPSRPAIGSFTLAGADFATDVRGLARAIESTGVAEAVVVRNDAHAALRAGTAAGWGVVVVCGAGVNAVARSPDGRVARLAAIGDLSGDFGGGYGIGLAALGLAVRGRDGRGARTRLEQLVPERFGLRRPIDVTRAVYEGRLSPRRLEELTPIVFDAAAAGDAVARGLVDRLADELATMAVAVARRVRIARREVEVVLTGGVFRATDTAFYDRIDARLGAEMPLARTARLRVRPVLGSALLGLDALLGGEGHAAEARLRRAFEGR